MATASATTSRQKYRKLKLKHAKANKCTFVAFAGKYKAIAITIGPRFVGIQPNPALHEWALHEWDDIDSREFPFHIVSKAIFRSITAPCYLLALCWHFTGIATLSSLEMASANATTRKELLTADYSCGYCLQRLPYMTDPRELPCTHVFCLACLQFDTRGDDGLKCTVCGWVK